MSIFAPPPDELQRAVDRANAAIRQFWMGLEGGHPLTQGEWQYHDALVADWNAAMVARSAAEREAVPAGVTLTSDC